MSNMSLYGSMRHGLEHATYRQLAIGVAGGAFVLWVLGKVLREVSHLLFPNVIPGEPNTPLLATPRPNKDSATAEDLKTTRRYDYIIIGGGTAGCVLANRLTEDPNTTVLVIEAGHSDLKQIFSRIPAGFGRLFSTAADWAFYTKKDTGCNDRQLFWPRGKMLGGCSAINAMIYNKGAAEDYDEWERLGNKGWGWYNVEEYSRKAEGFQQSPRSKLSAEDLVDHGRSGPWQTGYCIMAPLCGVFLDACEAVGIPKIADFNSRKGMLGASQFQTFIDSKGQRSSTAVAYLTKDVASRSNLSIATGQIVTKIVFDKSGAKPRAVGIEMGSSKASPIRYVVKARKEVILSAGAVQSPQILKLSGIGPAAELKQHNIPLIKDLLGVGTNLADHLCGIMVFESREKSLQYLVDTVKGIPPLIEWLRHGTGPMTTNVGEAGCFLNVAQRPDCPPSLQHNDLSSHPNAPDLELLVGALAYINHGKTLAPATKDYFSIGPIMLRPESRGSITLASSSPFDAPIIDANYLATQHDRDMMTYGMKLARDVAASAPFKQAFGSWYCPKNVEKMSDNELLETVRDHGETIYHPMCTNKMGNVEDETAVVDAELKVHGVEGLRVVDASVFPMPVACHPCAPVVMVAERAADLVKGRGTIKEIP
ncbi:Dehydrogenase [Fulvia fulva]|uniref:Dehydrogenase n=1 Tax=Passalora fulva TaxID=5499 RepID=A0A9Q8PCR1_PASFU|nr:Dehydrogenase [Fulvia fulva]KAK4620394.1 Dehydrogenase [Fulvia fulva]UJO20017.1 Dehydrogenase [Fulvia fulva]WPV16905.1 Dehydrogenase [Fulvia fulva]WPV32580.1 Dehydrogenase [Fulvia fulva]